MVAIRLEGPILGLAGLFLNCGKYGYRLASIKLPSIASDVYYICIGLYNVLANSKILHLYRLPDYIGADHDTSM